MGGGERNNPKQTLMHQPAQQLTGFWGPMPNVHIKCTVSGKQAEPDLHQLSTKEREKRGAVCKIEQLQTTELRSDERVAMREFCIN